LVEEVRVSNPLDSSGEATKWMPSLFQKKENRGKKTLLNANIYLFFYILALKKGFLILQIQIVANLYSITNDIFDYPRKREYKLK
jgi:hypothetical protein